MPVWIHSDTVYDMGEYTDVILYWAKCKHEPNKERVKRWWLFVVGPYLAD